MCLHVVQLHFPAIEERRNLTEKASTIFKDMDTEKIIFYDIEILLSYTMTLQSYYQLLAFLKISRSIPISLKVWAFV